MADLQQGYTGAPQLVRQFIIDKTTALLDDPRFTTIRDRDINGEALGAIFDEAVAALTTAEALERMVDNDVPGARVLRRDQVADDVQVIHNGSLVYLDDGPIGARVEARPAINFGGSERLIPPAAPALGANTVSVLASLGYDDDRISHLESSGVLGPHADHH